MTETTRYSEKLTLDVDGAVASVRLTNPDRHNAFDDGLIADITKAFEAVSDMDIVRAVILRADGKSFSAGADLNWMKRVAGYTFEENVADAGLLARMLQVIDTCPKPVVGRIQGAAFGGGVGLVSCCDIAIGTPRAGFSLSEVKLGLIPSAISPYVVKAIGARAARRYFLTAEKFDAAEAYRLGLLHDVVAEDALDQAVDAIVDAILAAGPNAVREAKDLIFAVDRPITQDIIDDTAHRISRVRATDEGQEGIASFLEKRKASWTH
ncbi:MAG: enoyl-CoA hydratase/isomerase family protein [Alphaproteobacteria bacterium]